MGPARPGRYGRSVRDIASGPPSKGPANSYFAGPFTFGGYPLLVDFIRPPGRKPALHTHTVQGRLRSVAVGARIRPPGSGSVFRSDGVRPGLTRRAGPTPPVCQGSAVPAFRFLCPLRWSDTDAYGHVNNVELMRLLEEARVALFFTQASADGVASFEGHIVVARHEVDFTAPLLWRPEPVRIDTQVTRIGGASFTLGLHDRRTRGGRSGLRPGEHGHGHVRPRARPDPSSHRGRARLPRGACRIGHARPVGCVRPAARRCCWRAVTRLTRPRWRGAPGGAPVGRQGSRRSSRRR